ncbi:hypothetical protein E2N92_04440 [Methanofollis formosanus]|uniref:Uncharacterized protein n=1 Tax=Methanofollis formosanus TaxID=299308 RepID=A0A8G1A1L8_9EURY|nr:hypothetical protein [Methanofollis formosanus]QYZ78729.1 hypothetical protein E2N92_04440 [Methanofollis formosanus]
MDIMDVINEILGRSRYLGLFAYFEMAREAKDEQGAIGVFVDGKRTSTILFSGGEPRGAIYLDEKGALYGDPAVLKIQESDGYDLYAVDRQVVDLVVARCRVFHRSYFPRHLSSDLPEIGGVRKMPGVLALLILRDDVAQEGARVSIRKGRHVLASDATTGDGQVSFRLFNGTYDIMVVDSRGEVATFMVDFKGERSELVIEMGGVTGV